MAGLLWTAAAAMADPHRVVLLQELVRLEAMEKKTVVQFPLQQQAAQLEMRFESKRGGEGVRVEIFANGSNVPIGGTTYELSGLLRVPLEREKTYRVEIENLRQRLGHALVDVEATLVFGVRAEAPLPSAARHLDPQRRRYTVAMSLSLFALIAGYAALRLTPPIVRRWRGEE
ncbi:MAG: hypothetical protein JNM66_22610 [Bryobacterales bacterium]|nr:hypothetical protein [Bryobacterales bacterium]